MTDFVSLLVSVVYRSSNCTSRNDILAEFVSRFKVDGLPDLPLIVRSHSVIILKALVDSGQIDLTVPLINPVNEPMLFNLFDQKYPITCIAMRSRTVPWLCKKNSK